MKTFIHAIMLCAALMLSSLMPDWAFAQETKQDSEDAILVLDGSGSMWGQIDGISKIEIARDVLGGLLDELPESRRLGLMAYGHNRKGDCSDIELLAPVGAPRADISKAVKAINPKGKTPISASVKQAAEALKYTENKATVILISDGIETCNLDPCALGKRLEADGVDFTAHVIGFDIVDQKAETQLQCLAESTGGRYLSASNAGELSIALGETVAEVDADAKPATLTLYATELTDGPAIEDGLEWTVQQAGGGDIIIETKDAGEITQDIPPGVYDVFVARASDGLKSEQRLVEILPGADRTLTLVLKPEFEATVTPDSGEVSAGSPFSVKWTGPDRGGDFIDIAKPDEGPRAYINYGYTNNGNPVKLTAPTQAGDYEVRYILGRPYRVLARAPITVSGVAATVSGPETAAAHSEITVDWTGPATQSDFVTITKLDAREGGYKNYFYTKNKVTPRKLTVPLEPGDYEIRYVFVGKSGESKGSGHKVLARQPLTVTGVTANVSAPKTARVGQSITVEWEGPKSSGDFVTITAPDARDQAYKSYAYTKNGSPSKLIMPLMPGDYEIRFVQDGKKILARQPITIEDITMTLKAPKKAKAGETIEINWDGPVAKGDWVTVIEPDAKETKYKSYFYPINGAPGKVAVPKEPGDYEIRYVMRGKRIIARQPIKVTE